MQNAIDGGIDIQPGDRNDACGSVVSELAALVEHVQASLKLIESAIAGEVSSGNPDASSNIVVLDDVTPCYAKASEVLKACDAGLGTILHFLLDSGISMRGEQVGRRAAGASDRRP